MPSDWYDEKSWSAAIHERNSSVHNATVSFGADVGDEQHRAYDAGGHEQCECRVASVEPEQRRRVPELPDARELLMDQGQVLAGWKNPPLADESVDLERERVERGKEDEPERTKEEPSRPEVTGRACFGGGIHCD